MEKIGGINLLRTDSSLSSRETVLLKRTKFISIGLLLFSIALGLLVASAFIIAQMRLNDAEHARTTLLRRIAIQARKEVLLRTLKERMPSADKVIASQYPWENILNQISTIAIPPFLQTVSINEKSMITLGVVATTFEEIEQMTQRLLELSQSGSIMSPTLVSIRSLQSGNYEVYFSFTPLQ